MSEPGVTITLDASALAELSEMTGGDVDFFHDLINTFLQDGDALLAEMERAATSSDLTALRRAAHTLKSNSRTFGATALGDVCQHIEHLAASGNLESAAEHVARVPMEYQPVAAALSAMRPA